MKMKLNLSYLIALLVMAGCTQADTSHSSDSDKIFEKYGQEFEGKIGKTYEESEEWWPTKKRPPAEAPNVIIFLLDDVGFAQVQSFGGLI